MMFIPASDECPGSWLLAGPPETPIHGRIWEHISTRLTQQPGADCLRCGDIVLSCAEAHRQTQDLAAKLRGQRIGVHVRRSVASVIATLATWCKGAVYIPLPSEFPPEHTRLTALRYELDFVVSDCLVSLNGYIVAEEVGLLGTLLRLLERIQPRDATAKNMTAENVAYIPHTSGSTGRPKGVKVSDGALIACLHTMQHQLSAGPEDRFLYKTSTVFDMHVWEFAFPLMIGALCVIYPQGSQFDLFDVARLLIEQNITIICMVPALLNALLDLRKIPEATALRVVLCGGEGWSPRLAEKFYLKLPGCQLYNSYGPAETTIAVANWLVPRDPVPDHILIGKPFDGVYFAVEEHERLIDPLGRTLVTGTLNVGGVQVALGYAQSTDHSEPAFYFRELNGKPLRWFRTGDLVQLEITNGELKFRGRLDAQIKVNGVRIELEDIEAVICSAENVHSCIVAVFRISPAPQIWAAIKVSDGALFDQNTIRSACERVLPRAYVPVVFMQMDDFPLQQTGKVDRMAVLDAMRANQKLDHVRI